MGRTKFSFTAPSRPPRTVGGSTQEVNPLVSPGELSGSEETLDRDLLGFGEDPDDVGSPGVLGKSSGAGFMAEAYQALNRGNYDKPLRVSQSTERGRSGTRLQASMVVDFSLPPRSMMDPLLRMWWEQVHPLNPILHQPTFMNR